MVPLSNYINSKNSKICLTQSLQIITVMLQEGGLLLKPFFKLGALAFSHLLMPVALSLLDY
jgi:hypothetical protein